MRTGRKSRRKNRKSRGYIVPMCLALSGAIMSGMVSAAEGATSLGEINKDYDYSACPKSGLQRVEHDDNTVKLYNIGVVNDGYDAITYYFSGINAPGKNIEIEWNEDANKGEKRFLQDSTVRSHGEQSSGGLSIVAKNFSISADFDSTASGENAYEIKRYDNRGLFADEQGSLTVDVS